MAATFLTMKYGPLGADGARPLTLSLSYPLWLMDGPPRRVHRERLLEVAVQEGSVVDSLGQDPVTLTLRLELRPGEQPGVRAQDALNRVRRVLGETVSLELGDEDWGDGWRLKDLREEYRRWNLPSDTGGPVSPVRGGMAIATAAVELVLVRGVSGEATVEVGAPLVQPGFVPFERDVF